MTRGLGEKQQNARHATIAKICALVAIQPFTYEQLWKESRIHRNTLQCRLKELFASRLILKVKIPKVNNHNSSRYGTYYILNYNSQKAIDRAIDYYLEYCYPVNEPKKDTAFFKLLSIVETTDLQKMSKQEYNEQCYLARDIYNQLKPHK